MTITRRELLGASAALALAPTAIARAATGSGPSGSPFPAGFLWGAATAAHQVEGNNINAETWVLENVKPTVYAEPSLDAMNSFALWPQDLDLVKSLNLNAYRFSLEWARIEPAPGEFSLAMLDHYKAIIAGCHERGIQPVVTFNHFTTPRWFAARGGWTGEGAADLFANFCDRAARHMADGMAYALTLNEPNLIHVVRNALPAEVFAGFKVAIEQMNAAAAAAVGSDRFVSGNAISGDDPEHHTAVLIAAHKAGRAAIKAVRSDLPVGVTLAMPDDEAVGENSKRDAIRARSYQPWLEAAREDDFLGVQNYERTLWDANGLVEDESFSGDRNAAGAPVYPPSLANAVRYAWSVAQVPIIVTEHGVNTEDDAVRARLIPAALGELRKAIDEGVPVRGYMHWSLIDNFEWIFGYKYKYGLASVDRTTFKRTAKPSAKVLAEIAGSNSLPGQ